MKIIISILIIVLCSMCTCTEQISSEEKVLMGEHKLRKFITTTEKTSAATGGFFLFLGAASGNSTQNEICYFSWQMSDDSYVISKLPLVKIRVRLIEGIEIPTIRFQLSKYYRNIWKEDIIDKISEECVLYATITCNPKDWQLKIEMPLN